MKTLFLCSTLLSATSRLWAAFVVVTPSGWDSTAAPAFALEPFGVATSSVRYQQVSDPRAFPRFGGTVHEYWISGMVFRSDEAALGTYLANTEFQINLSTTLRSPDGLSTLFADNVGTDDIAVFPRSRMTILAPPGGASSPVIQFTQPFYYDTRAGNLLLDVRYYGLWFGDTATLDAVNDPNDDTSRVWANSVNATSGTADSLGLVLGFYVTPIPEPATVSLLFCGAAVLGFVLRRQTHRKP